MKQLLALSSWIFLLMIGCVKKSTQFEPPTTLRTVEADATESAPSSDKILNGIKRIAIIGDSLTEGYGVPAESSFPKVLEKLCHENGRLDIEVMSSGSSGSTSASGPSRVQWALKSKPDLIIVALGANDGLRGLEVEQMRKNLERTIQEAKKAQVKVVLAGMKAPPNLGRDYTKAYENSFSEVAHAEGIPLFPFLLEGVAGEPELNIDDGIHPNEAGHQIMGQNLFRFLTSLKF